MFLYSFFSLLFWQLDFLDQTLSLKFTHLSAMPGILFAKMTGLMILERLRVKIWAIMCKSNPYQSLKMHRMVKISLLQFLRMHM